MTTLHLDPGSNGYDITVGYDLLAQAGKLFNLERRVTVVTDNGVPREYAEKIAGAAKSAIIVTVNSGEDSKSLGTLERVLTEMASFGMTRADCVVAVGGGVVGDLAGFAAASYMRGIDFYNVPTTLLSQVDSSIGGKTAVNLGGIKNIVGAFHQPRGVLIDVACLKTLDDRQIKSGLAEAVKMAMTSDAELFKSFEKYSYVDIMSNIKDIIVSALKIKKQVVEIDEHESGLRKILNFGHTFGHGIEAEETLGGLLHGECVALGMIPMCGAEARARLTLVLEKIGLPTKYSGSIDRALAYVAHDKKATAGGITTVLVQEIGAFEMKKMTVEELGAMVREVF